MIRRGKINTEMHVLDVIRTHGFRVSLNQNRASSKPCGHLDRVELTKVKLPLCLTKYHTMKTWPLLT